MSVAGSTVVHRVTDELLAASSADVQFGALPYYYATRLALVRAVPLQRPQTLDRVRRVLGGGRVGVPLYLKTQAAE